jgi:hypothetical protein
LSTVNPHVDIALAKLQGMQNQPGPCLKEFLDSVTFVNDSQCSYRNAILSCTDVEVDTFEVLKSSYITGVIEAIKNRFENDTSSALNCFSLIEPATTLSDECTANYLQLITDKFGFVVNIASLQSELIAVNSLKNGCYKGYSMRNFAEVMISRHIDQMPETSKLCEIALCIPVSTAVCERGFSRQNFKKK